MADCRKQDVDGKRQNSNFGMRELEKGKWNVSIADLGLWIGGGIYFFIK
jgi:hypothetical protein